MQGQKERGRRRKSRRHPNEGGQNRKWMRIEYYLCAIALIAALAMTGTMVSHAVYAVGESRRDAAEAARNEPEYVTFIRGVINHLTDGEGEKPEEAESLPVDITQFADDTGFAGQVYALREEYPEQVETILSNYENAAIYVDGAWTTVGEEDPDAIPERLLEMVINNVETIDFAAAYPEKRDQAPEIDLTGEFESGKVPLLIQWDERWGYIGYGDGLLGYTGCGPTCLSMVAISLTGDVTLTPKAVADYADQAGYYTNGVGSAWSLMTEGSQEFGLTGTQVTISEQTMADKLAEGYPLICAMGPGDFTQNGHFIVICGYENGQFVVNDPNSPIRSSRTWSYAELGSQIKNAWYFSAG